MEKREKRVNLHCTWGGKISISKKIKKYLDAYKMSKKVVLVPERTNLYKALNLYKRETLSDEDDICGNFDKNIFCYKLNL